MKKTNKKRKHPEAAASPSAIGKKNTIATPLNNSHAIEKYFTKYGLYILVSLIFVISFFVFRDFITFKKVYLFKDIGSDSINIYLPYWIYIADYLRTDGIPQWSNQIGMGQNVYMFDMGNPFSLLLYAAGRDNIPYMIIYVELLKILLSGIVIYYYIKSFNISNYVAILGALIYAFSGYMILGGSGWYHQSTEVFFAALFLFAVERFLKNEWYWLTLSACLIGLCNAYFLFSYGILLFIYLSVRYIDEKGFNLKKHFFLLLYAGGCYALGMLISSVFVINFFLAVYNSPRVSGSASGFSKFFSMPMFGTAEAMEYISFFMRLFSNDIIGNGSNYKGWGNYLEGPVLYIGLFSLLIFTQFFSGLTKQRRSLYIGSALFVLMIILFPFFRYMFWGFGLDYFRTFSFFISLFIFYAAIRALSKIMDTNTRINIIMLLVTSLVCFAILYFNDPIKNQILIKEIRKMITIFLLAYTALLILYRYNINKPAIKIAILCLVCIELIYCSNATVSKRTTMDASELEARIGYNDHTVDAISYLKSHEKEPFYRITKYYFSGLSVHGSMNDGMIQDYKNTISYSSLNQKYYIKFLEGIGVVKKGNSNDVKWAMGVTSRPLLQSLVSCKYVLKKSQQGALDTMGYEKISTFEDVELYRNKTYLPLGITFNKYIFSSDFEKMSDMNKDVALFKGVVIEDSLFQKFSDFNRVMLEDTVKYFTWNEFHSRVDSLKREHFTISNLSNNHIEGSIGLDRKKLLMLSIPFDEGWKLKVDGKDQPIEIVNYGLMGVMLDKGQHQLSFDFIPPFKYLGISLSVVFLLLFILVFVLYRKRTLIQIDSL